MQHVDVYSDGSSRGNPGRGGFGSILRYVSADNVTHEREISEGYKVTTNNRMELLGVICALEALKAPCDVDVYTDSQYVVNAFNQHWIENWVRNGWRKSDKKPVLNADLWRRLIKAMDMHEVKYHWVRGHAGHPENERCDALATSAADGSSLKEDANYTGD